MNNFILVNGKRVQTVFHDGHPLLSINDIASACGYKSGWTRPFKERVTRKINNRAFISVESACELLPHTLGKRRDLAFAAIEQIREAFAEIPVAPTVKSNGTSDKAHTTSESSLIMRLKKQIIDEDDAILQEVYKLARRIEERNRCEISVKQLETPDQPEMWFGTEGGIQ